MAFVLFIISQKLEILVNNVWHNIETEFTDLSLTLGPAWAALSCRLLADQRGPVGPAGLQLAGHAVAGPRVCLAAAPPGPGRPQLPGVSTAGPGRGSLPSGVWLCGRPPAPTATRTGPRVLAGPGVLSPCPCSVRVATRVEEALFAGSVGAWRLSA